LNGPNLYEITFMGGKVMKTPHAGVGKNLFHISISYESGVSATLTYFFLGSGKLDPKERTRNNKK